MSHKSVAPLAQRTEKVVPLTFKLNNLLCVFYVEHSVVFDVDILG